MRLATHEKNTKKLFGVKGTDIHQWIDGHFDHQQFQRFIKTGFLGDFNPYDHRVHRHCEEAIEECIEEFKDKYPPDLIIKIFESHVKDDYYGYFPSKKDFDDPDFHDKYHKK